MSKDQYIFFIEYDSGKRTEIRFRTQRMAIMAYTLYSKEPEDDARTWGWEPDVFSLHRQIKSRSSLVA